MVFLTFIICAYGASFDNSKNTGNDASLTMGRTYSPVVVLTVATRVRPLGLGCVLMTRPIGHFPLSCKRDGSKMSSLILIFSRHVVHLFYCSNVFMYSRLQRIQN